MLGLDGIHRASSSRIGPRASARSSRLTTIGLSRRFLAGSNAAADNYRIGNARSSFHGGLSRTRVRLPPPPPFCLMKIQAIVHKAEEGGFWAEVPSIPGCATQGETMEELRHYLREAIEGCLSVPVEASSTHTGDQVIELAL